MRIIHVFALVALLLVTGCNVAPSALAIQVAQYQNNVEKLVIKWNGHLELAQSTAHNAIALNPVVAMLQQDQQEFMALAVPEPLENYQDQMNDGMQSFIQSFTTADGGWIVYYSSEFDNGYEGIMAYRPR